MGRDPERSSCLTYLTYSAPGLRSLLPRGVVGIEAEQLCRALDRLEALFVVKDAKAEAKPHLGRVICNLWCRCTHAEASMKQPSVALNKKPRIDEYAVPDFLIAAEKLIIKVAHEHRGCVAAAETAKANAQQAST